MAILINKLDSVSPDLEAKLRARKIRDSNELLAACRKPIGYVELAQQVQVEPQVIHRLAHRADLVRIRGVGSAYIKLLEEAGVLTMEELAQWRPEQLRGKLVEINLARKLVGRMPTLAMVTGWVTKAQRLPRVLEN